MEIGEISRIKDSNKLSDGYGFTLASGEIVLVQSENIIGKSLLGKKSYNTKLLRKTVSAYQIVL